jgi:hypothetical protein
MKKRKINPKSLANLTPYKPGQSGNPKGKAKGTYSSLTSIVRNVMANINPKTGRPVSDVLGDVIVAKCLAGDVRMIEAVWERLEPRIMGGAPETEEKLAVFLHRLYLSAEKVARDMFDPNNTLGRTGGNGKGNGRGNGHAKGKIIDVESKPKDDDDSTGIIIP